VLSGLLRRRVAAKGMVIQVAGGTGKKWYGGDRSLTVRMFITMALLLVVYGVFLGILYRAGASFITMAVVAGAFVVGQFFFSDRLVLLTTGARIVSPEEAPELHDVIDRLAALADLPKPKVAIIDTQIPNAFATGRNEKNAVVAVTTGLVNQLERPELEAVLAHELTHIKNKDMMVLTIASFLSTVAFMIVRFSFWFGGGLGGRGRDRSSGGYVALAYVAAIAVWFVSMLLIKALSRYREFAADRGSAIITGQPSNLSSALLKISGRMQQIPERDLREVQGANAFFIIPAARGSSIGNSFMELFSTHPSLEKRLARLQQYAQDIEGK
jgi:heat shock protein HtpX